jgi:hypothetical protein
MQLANIMFFVLLFSFGTNNSLDVIKDYPLFKQLEVNEGFNAQFNKYMEFASQASPDGKKVYAIMQAPEKSLSDLSTIFHERVELMEWMNLKHKFEDIMNPEYNRAHYMEVYPIAHRKAVIEEIGLLKYYAMKKNYPNIPEVVYNLVSPLIESYGVAVERMQRRIQFNQEYLAQVKYVTRNDIETAIKIYEEGGYTYKDKARLINESLELIKKSWQ